MSVVEIKVETAVSDAPVAGLVSTTQGCARNRVHVRLTSFELLGDGETERVPSS